MTLGRRTKRLTAGDAADLALAGEILRGGGLVAFPTETVYGLGANAMSAEAVAGIFEAKQRPQWDPLIVHLADRTGVVLVATPTPLSKELMEAFWPGPLTLLLPRTKAVPDAVTAGRALVGVRIPAHPVAQALLEQAGVPIAAPSANRFGHTSPTTAAHVLADLDGRIDAVLDGGSTCIGVESTVVEVCGAEIVIYRHGAVTREMLEAVAGRGRVRAHRVEFNGVPPASLPSPGVGIRHYAPAARVVLVHDGSEAALLKHGSRCVQLGERVGVMLPDDWEPGAAQTIYAWGPWGRPDLLASRLFAGLRALDDERCTVIICPLPAGQGIEEAIRDRLEKAARTV